MDLPTTPGGSIVEARRPLGVWRHDLVFPQSGARFEIRPITPDDDNRMAKLFAQQTEEERRMRYMFCKQSLPRRELEGITHVDYVHDFALCAVDRATDSFAGLARYVKDTADDDCDKAEISFEVLKSYQGKGLGRYLLSLLVTAANAHGLRHLSASVLHVNQPCVRCIDRVAEQERAKVHTQSDRDGLVVRIELVRKRRRSLVQPPSPSLRPPSPVSGKKVPEAVNPQEVGDTDMVRQLTPNSEGLCGGNLHFPNGDVLEVRPADPDDELRARMFAERMRSDFAATISQTDFRHDMALVVIDRDSDAMVAAAISSWPSPGAPYSVFVLPEYEGLGLAPCLKREIARTTPDKPATYAPRSAPPLKYYQTGLASMVEMLTVEMDAMSRSWNSMSWMWGQTGTTERVG